MRGLLDRWRASAMAARFANSLEAKRTGEMPMPAPWAAAVAVLALLAFGVFVGSAVSPARPSAATVPVLLAASPRTAVAGTPAVTPEPTPQPSSTPPEASAEPTPETTTVTQSAEGAPTSKVTTPQPAGGGLAPAAAALPPVKHVFLIVLSDGSFGAALGPGSQAPYLSKTLRGQGELLESYYAVSSGELANAIALISGQGPTPQTQADCPLYADLAPGTAGADGQTLGSGCVYPPTTLTLAGQLAAKNETWRAYVEDIGAGGPGQPASCRHPTLGEADADHAPMLVDAYVTWRNPFVYFHSLIDSGACAANDVGLDRLAPDLASAGTTPSLAYIVPNHCHDGSPQPCVPGQPAGLAAADAFLHQVVPKIESSAAYRDGGLIAITFDQAPQEGPNADSSGCCIASPYSNVPGTAAPSTVAAAGATSTSTNPTTTTTSTTTATATTTAPTTSTAPTPTAAGATGSQGAAPAGGGKVGLLLISKYVKPGSIDVTGDYNHFALLRSIENLFGLQPLGYAGVQGLLAFDNSVFNARRQTK